MSFVLDNVRAIGGRLDRLQLGEVFPGVKHIHADCAHDSVLNDRLSSHIDRLQELTKSLSTTSTTGTSLLSASRCAQILEEAKLSHSSSNLEAGSRGKLITSDVPESTYQHDLEWYFISKATVQAYGLVLEALINQAIPLSDEIWYWDNVLGSYSYMALYSMQTSPLRLWDWSRSVYSEVRQRSKPVGQGWNDFYRLVRNVVRDRSMADVPRRIATPLTLIQKEVRQKRAELERARTASANGIGHLLSNAFNTESSDSTAAYRSTTKDNIQDPAAWKASITETIAVLDAIVRTTGEQHTGHDSFEEAFNGRLINDPLQASHPKIHDYDAQGGDRTILATPADLSERLQVLLRSQLPLLKKRSAEVMGTSSRPSLLVRYWLPTTLLLVSSNVIYRFIMNREAAILESIRDFGKTVMDFWKNWVIEPVRHVIGTIRHDAASEVSLMSKGSLEGDRASLERMVVDFARINQTNGNLDPAAIDAIKASVREGDLTTVLKVYEKELQHPLRGSIMGSLVQALLIQVQKTKVDIEIAMGGIDSLLKSQELVFGFVGLTPGMLVTYFLFRWIWNLPDGRRNARSGEKRAHALQVLRNIDRILTASSIPNDGRLPFHEHGLLVCETIALRGLAARTFPKQVFREFLQDFDHLINVDGGVGRQIRVADRMRWAYARWLLTA